MSEQNPYGQGPQDPYGQDPWGQQPTDPYGQPAGQPQGGSYGQQQGAYGQTPYGAGTYGNQVPSWQQTMGVGAPVDPNAYASWGQRAGAYLLDQLVSWLVGLVFLGGLVMLISELHFEEVASNEYTVHWKDGSAPGSALLVMGVGLLLLLAFGIYNWGYRQGTTGSTIGKKIVGIQVVNEATMRPLGTLMSIVRQLVHFVDGLFFSIGYLWPLWDNKRQTFADKIMATVVVPVPEKPLPDVPWTHSPH